MSNLPAEKCLACETGLEEVCKQFVDDDTESCATCHHSLECHEDSHQ